MMILVGALLLAMGIICGTVLLARVLEARAWRRSLISYRLTLPSDITIEMLAAWVGRIAATTQAPRGALVSFPPVAVSIVARQGRIRHELHVPRSLEGAVLAGLRASLPGLRLEAVSTADIYRPTVAAEARLTGHRRPLAVERAEATSAHILASLLPLGSDEEIRLDWILTGAGTPPPIRSTDADSGRLQDLIGHDRSIDSDELRAARLKQRDPLVHAVVRLGVSAQHRPTAYQLFGREWGSLRGMNAPGAMIVRRAVPSFMVAGRMQRRAMPLIGWPLLLGSRELAGLLGMATDGLHLPGLTRGSARQLPPANHVPTTGTIVAKSNYVGLHDRPLALHSQDRLRHMWAIGPTGSGKSTLLTQLICQDMVAGRGLVVIDPKGGDLVHEVLARVPEERRDDVVVLDPSASDFPIGLNVLDLAGGEQARELAVDHLVHVMASLWKSSFGPRTADVLRNSLLTLTHTRAADGSLHTLVDLPELLLNARYRAFVVRQASVPPTVRPFWMAYEQMSDNERAQVIGPSLNKLRSFTTRTALRLMLGQSHGVRLSDVFTERRILLVSLATGILGSETTALLGSLVMAGLWSATQGRAAIAAERRHAAFIYLDEFQNFMRLDVDLASMLAEARGYGVGLVLAHQYLDQLSPEVQAAVLGTVRTHVAFAVELDDARRLAPRFAPLSAEDLTGLPAYEIALRACVNGQTLAPATGITLPLLDPATDGQALATYSRQRFGVARSDVEAALTARITVEATTGNRFGRQPRMGGDV